MGCRRISAFPWASMGCRNTDSAPWSALEPAGKSWLQHLEQLLLFLHCPWCLQGGFSDTFTLYCCLAELCFAQYFQFFFLNILSQRQCYHSWLTHPWPAVGPSWKQLAMALLGMEKQSFWQFLTESTWLVPLLLKHGHTPNPPLCCLKQEEKKWSINSVICFSFEFPATLNNFKRSYKQHCVQGKGQEKNCLEFHLVISSVLCINWNTPYKNAFRTIHTMYSSFTIFQKINK